MKDGLIHVCFVLDESGSMSSSTSDVKGGFKTVIEEQKAQAKGGCIISLFKFSSTVDQIYLGKDVNEIDGDNLDYSAHGMTAMNDGIATAIDSVGKWLADMDESERPEKNLVVIMTDGAENFSKEFTIEQVREKIAHQTDKYNWSFVYMGTDVTDSSYANHLTSGLKNCTTMFNSRDKHKQNYDVIGSVATAYRCSTSDAATKSATLDSMLFNLAETVTAEYEASIGHKVK